MISIHMESRTGCTSSTASTVPLSLTVGHASPMGTKARAVSTRKPQMRFTRERIALPGVSRAEGTVEVRDILVPFAVVDAHETARDSWCTSGSARVWVLRAGTEARGRRGLYPA